MKYIAIIHKDEDSSYGVTLPDFPGCFSAADNIEDLGKNIQEAVELYADGEESFEPPLAMAMEEVQAMEEAENGILMLVDIDFGFLNSKTVPVNLSMPVYMRSRTDRAAKQRGLSRSELVIKALLALGV